MIDYEILQDIITDHKLCKVQENELAKVVELLKTDRLIELPCKVGEPLYKLLTKCETTRYCPAEYCSECGLKDVVESVAQIPFFINPIDYFNENMGKTVFLTKEEAEAKLAELKGE